MDEEVVWVGSACVFILRGIWLVIIGMRAFVMPFCDLPVREDDDFVDAEDGEGAGYGAAEGGSQFVGLCAGVGLAE
jgi:hypothetical protein